MTIDELIAALEAATGPDRRLDAEIAKCVGDYHGPREVVHLESRSYDSFPDVAPLYTASLNASTPGEDIHAVERITGLKDGREFHIWRAWQAGSPDRGIGHTEAIARRIAALRARKT